MERQTAPNLKERTSCRFMVKVIFFLHISMILIIVYTLLEDIAKNKRSDEDELYSYLMRAGLVSSTINVIKFIILRLVRKTEKIVDENDHCDEQKTFLKNKICNRCRKTVCDESTDLPENSTKITRSFSKELKTFRQTEISMSLFNCEKNNGVSEEIKNEDHCKGEIKKPETLFHSRVSSKRLSKAFTMKLCLQ